MAGMVFVTSVLPQMFRTGMKTIFAVGSDGRILS
jgi:hypothetical protein